MCASTNILNYMLKICHSSQLNPIILKVDVVVVGGGQGQSYGFMVATFGKSTSIPSRQAPNSFVIAHSFNSIPHSLAVTFEHSIHINSKRTPNSSAIERRFSSLIHLFTEPRLRSTVREIGGVLPWQNSNKPFKSCLPQQQHINERSF